MRTYLRGGEIANLLSSTTKTIRHYHKVGLVAEPDRTDAGYCLYSASDVLRILCIRRLQALERKDRLGGRGGGRAEDVR
jgi:DNA-binding transcriptional MerR regulator